MSIFADKTFVQLLLTLPILYAGGPFFKNGIISLKNGVPSMDTLVEEMH